MIIIWLIFQKVFKCDSNTFMGSFFSSSLVFSQHNRSRQNSVYIIKYWVRLKLIRGDNIIMTKSDISFFREIFFSSKFHTLNMYGLKEGTNRKKSQMQNTGNKIGLNKCNENKSRANWNRPFVFLLKKNTIKCCSFLHLRNKVREKNQSVCYANKYHFGAHDEKWYDEKWVWKDRVILSHWLQAC